MTQQELEQLAANEAARQQLDPALVKSVCQHESSWNPGATRFEPAFFNRYVSPMKGLTADEMRLRATSLGLMQIMGQTAREQGYDDPLPNLLASPADQVAQGCEKLARCLEATGGDVERALLRYNGGLAPEYPGLVLQYYDGYREAR